MTTSLNSPAPAAIKLLTNTSFCRRKLLAKLSNVAPDQLSALSIVKAVLSNGSTASVYVSDDEPVVFELEDEGILYPTLYLTWLFPNVVPVLLMKPDVMSFLEKGANLMLPGVILPTDHKMPEIQKDTAVAICIYDAIRDTVTGPVAVGRLLLSTQEMLDCQMKGRGVNIMHVAHDALWEFGSKRTAPKLSLDAVYTRNFDKEVVIEQLIETTLAQEDDKQLDSNTQATSTEDPPATEAEKEPQVDMDELLRHMFLWTLKSNAAQLAFPMDVGQFYATFIVKQLPDGTKIDLKKTRHKKFTNFLKHMNDEAPGLLTISSKKGVDSFQDSATPISGAPSQQSGQSVNPERVTVSECFSATEAVMTLLGPLGCSRGEVLQSNQLRDLVLCYAQSKNLLTEDNRVELDDTLQIVIRHFLFEKVKLNELVQKIGAAMTKCWVVALGDGRRIVKKNQMPTIEFKVEKRSGNKLVTLINNTSNFGIDTKRLCQKIQSSMATGATVNQEVPNCTGPQILVHGNQIHLIDQLLQNDYGIERKYMKGLELGIKPKKKGR